MPSKRFSSGEVILGQRKVRVLNAFLDVQTEEHQLKKLDFARPPPW